MKDKLERISYIYIYIKLECFQIKKKKQKTKNATRDVPKNITNLQNKKYNQIRHL